MPGKLRACYTARMEPFDARPKTTKAPKARDGAAASKGAVRDLPPVGVRIPPELLARLDAIVERRSRAIVAMGGAPSRNATIVAALMEFCDREEKRVEDEGDRRF